MTTSATLITASRTTRTVVLAGADQGRHGHGTAIKWNGAEKFYNSEAWMSYLIDLFLKPGADRDRVIELLRAAVADGRLDRAEFDERLPTSRRRPPR
jgi:hypothetical protein